MCGKRWLARPTMTINFVWETLVSTTHNDNQPRVGNVDGSTTHHEGQSVLAVGMARFCIMRVTLRRYVTFPRGFADNSMGDGHSLLKSTHYAPTKLEVPE